MKIAILGTRGIPNNYGGFEQFAENLSVNLVQLGHNVIVYNPSYHPYLKKDFYGVNIVRIACYEKFLGGLSHFIYDYYCLKDAVKHKVDVVLMCGYGTSAPALALIKKGITKIITNMDGFEWNRSKYNSFTKNILKWLEGIAIKHSNLLVADHSVVQKYYLEKYRVLPMLIPYGAIIPSNFDEAIPAYFGLLKNNYFLVVARDEPENQIEFIISAWKESGSSANICIVTNFPRLSKKYARQKGIVIITRLYDYLQLSNLRHFSLACLHGHTVGGTNPSLLEAMATQSFIIAHENVFHRFILGENANYFSSQHSLTTIIREFSSGSPQITNAINNNLAKIRNNYQWASIADTYVEVFKNITK